MTLGNAPPDAFLAQCNSYEDYLDTFITSSDLRYLGNIDAIRQLVELNYRTSSEVYTPKQYELRREIVLEQLAQAKQKRMLYSIRLKSVDPVLIQLAAREMANYQKMISTIIFISFRKKNGFEASGFIDLEDSLHRSNLNLAGSTDWVGVFREKVKLRPKPSDLSYYDVHTGSIYYNNSNNYVVSHDVYNGLTFIHRGDHKKICVDNSQPFHKRNYLRTVQFSNKYGYVIFFDHIIRKKI